MSLPGESTVVQDGGIKIAWLLTPDGRLDGQSPPLDQANQDKGPSTADVILIFH